MADKDQPRDWDRELAEVDKLLAKLPNADPTLGRTVPVRAAAPATTGSGGTFGTWVRVGLAVTLAIGMTVWPYAHACGLQLAYYAGGIVMVIFAGVWGAVSSWQRRVATAHLLSLGAVIWGLVLAATVVVPRAGYAKTPATWLCQ